MFRVSLANAFAKRTLRPLLEKHQATPFAGTLDSTAANTDIYSGMVASLGSDGEFEISTHATQPFGLFALDSNAVIDDLDGQPNDFGPAGAAGYPFAVWQGGPDAYFRIDSPAFNTGGSITVGSYLYCDASGKLAVSGQNSATNANWPIAQVVEVTSSTRLVIRVLLPVAGDAVASG